MVDKATGEPTERPVEFVPPRIHLAPDYRGYSCPISGKWIEGRRAHTENLKRNDCRVLEKGERQEAGKRRAEADRAFERRVSEAVEKTAAELS